MHIGTSGVAAVWGNKTLRWCSHQCELDGDSGKLRCWVGWLRRTLPVKFRRQTSYLSHKLCDLNMKSQFDIYFTNRKTQMNKTNNTSSKLNREIQIFGPI
jgi:hypothetical protein